jgi:hypothetical protein
MEAVARNRESRIWSVVATILGAVHMIDFIFYGKDYHNLVAALGFALMAHSAWRNGFQKLSNLRESEFRPFASAYYTAVVGAVLVVVSLVIKYAL